MNQPIREALPTPAGWLVAPTRDFCLFFIRDPKSVMVAPTVFTQLWYCTEDGTPTKLKNTRKLDYESAHETWNELLSNDWELVEHHFNACVDAAYQKQKGNICFCFLGDADSSSCPNLSSFPETATHWH